MALHISLWYDGDIRVMECCLLFGGFVFTGLKRISQLLCLVSLVPVKLCRQSMPCATLQLFVVRRLKLKWKSVSWLQTLSWRQLEMQKQHEMITAVDLVNTSRLVSAKVITSWEPACAHTCLKNLGMWTFLYCYNDYSCMRTVSLSIFVHVMQISCETIQWLFWILSFLGRFYAFFANFL